MDDLSNNWGTVLVTVGRKERNGTPHKFIMDERIDLVTLKSVVLSSTSKDYELCKLCSCGTDANVHSILEATEGDTSKCLFAAGSYLGGDDSVLHCLSTSHEIEPHGPCILGLPHETSAFGRKQNIGLPYHIPCTCCSDDILHPYEDMCLHELHLRLLAQRLTGSPYKALLLELCLAGCGAILSDRALGKLGHLAKKHDLRLIVDEIMTGGRTSPSHILLTQTKPREFQDQVTHITMGKWPGIGIVLRKNSHNHCAKTPNLKAEIFKTRGVSSQPSCAHALVCWRAVMANLGNIETRRESILQTSKFKKNMGPSECWGQGLLIFLPYGRIDNSHGLKNRFLPQLADVPLDSVRGNGRPDWKKENMCGWVMAGVTSWVNHRPMYEGVGLQTALYAHG
jgi:hypothetical protein